MLFTFLIFFVRSNVLRGMEESNENFSLSIYNFKSRKAVNKELKGLATRAHDERNWQEFVELNEAALAQQTDKIISDANRYKDSLTKYSPETKFKKKLSSTAKTFLIYAAVGIPLTYLSYKYGILCHSIVQEGMHKKLPYFGFEPFWLFNLRPQVEGLSELIFGKGYIIIPTLFGYQLLKDSLNLIRLYSPQVIISKRVHKVSDMNLLVRCLRDFQQGLRERELNYLVNILPTFATLEEEQFSKHSKGEEKSLVEMRDVGTSS